MARGKVQMRRIENPVHRQVTFCKRRMGLLKKAKELSVLCDADIGVIVFSPHGKIYELATNGNMAGLIERYKSNLQEAQIESSEQNISQVSQVVQQEVLFLRQEVDLLQNSLRYMYGDKYINQMNLGELQSLESKLEAWVHNIRTTKMQIMSKEIEMLKNKEGILKAANIIEQTSILDVGGNIMIPQVPFQLTTESNYYF
ncbi:MADS-box transcription factor 26-like [Oryza brachyantha]|uniref:MADS-box transcription factor 26-like n=1 Tax=Oryza brachyantha TaxID=4533 RepID=UPI001AD9A3ED|nr:MADS-box transcription factor 26-like [Oryza brachyantha]